MSANDHPYGVAVDPLPRYVCVACYRTASVDGGDCSRCGAVRVPIDHEDVNADVRARAARVQEQRNTRGVTATVFGSLALAIVVYVLLVESGVVAFRWIPFRGPAWLSLIWLVCALFVCGPYVLISRRRTPDIDTFSSPIAAVLAVLRVRIE